MKSSQYVATHFTVDPGRGSCPKPCRNENVPVLENRKNLQHDKHCEQRRPAHRQLQYAPAAFPQQLTARPIPFPAAGHHSARVPGKAKNRHRPYTAMTDFDERDLRDVLGTFATGVTVVTTSKAGRQPVGITVNSFTSVSLAPPLVLWCLGNDAVAYDDFADCRHFAVHVLGESQQRVSEIFASGNSDKFAGLAWDFGELGSPLLADCMSCLQCETETVYAGGDHVILLGRVKSIQSQADEGPLVYYGGAYHSLKT